MKVIILDVDGTLTNSKKEITPKTKEALLKVQESGVRLVLASGRTENGLKRYAQELEMNRYHGILVCSNGAEVVDFQTKEIYYKQCLSIQDAKEVLEHIKSFDIVPVVSNGAYMYTNDVFNHDIQFNGKLFNILKYESRGNGYKLCEIDDLAQWLDFEPTKILTYGTPEYLQQHYKEISEPFTHLNSMFTAPYYYEFTAQGVDKTKAIQESLLKLGYSKDDLIAFGDAQNDQSMIEFSKIGVAMGNATEELKHIADDVTKTNDEDGIAYSLYKYFPALFEKE